MGVRRTGRRVSSRWLASVAAVALVAAVAGCGTSGTSPRAAGSPPAEPVRGGNLVVGTSGDVNGFNPIVSQWSGPAYVIGRAVMDPLVVMDRNGDWQPYLAKEITPNEDFTEWTIELRPGVVFHNGEALDAGALALFLEAATESPLSSQGFPEKPAIAIVDDLRVKMTFTRPWSAMPTVFVEQPGYVIAPEQVRSGDVRHPIGTGPFVFDEWVPDDHVRVSRNSDYWRAGLPYLDGIEFRPFADPTARDNTLRTGGVDVVEQYGVGRPALDALAADGLRVIDDVDNVGSAVLLMNCDSPPLGDHDVRRAVVSAIDRTDFRDTVLDASFELADQPYAPGNRWHTEVDYPDFDPELARRLVDEYETEHGPLRLRLMTVSGGSLERPLYVQEALGNVGIDLQIEDLELAAFVQRLVAGDYDAVFLGSFFGAPDPDGNYPFWTSAGADPTTPIKLNFARYRNPVVDEALETQRRTDDPDARKAEWAKVWQALAEDLPYAFLYHDHYALISQPDVYGLDAPTTPDGAELPAINRWTPFFTQVFVAR